MNFITMFSRLYEIIINFTAIVTCFLIFLLMATVGFDVFMRYFWGRPQAWVLESTELALLYLTFLGSAWVLGRDGHVKMDFLLDCISDKARLLLIATTSFIGAIVCLIVVWYGVQFTWDQYTRNVSMTSVLGIPNAVTVGIIPLGCALLFIQFIRRGLKQVSNVRKL